MNKPPFIAYEKYEDTAAQFLSEHNSKETIPVPIEDIIELSLGMAIVPVGGLIDISGGVNAFITRDLKELRVDAGLYNSDGSRFRFSLAHELSHLLLGHNELLNNFSNVDEWVNYFSQLPREIYELFEVQANKLAGHLLVPSKGLKDAFHRQLTLIGEELENKLDLQDRATSLLANEYKVSDLTAHIRLRDAKHLLVYPPD